MGVVTSRIALISWHSAFNYFTGTSEGVNIEELVDDFVTFYVAGQETTSSLLSFALIFTLQNPHVLERYS